MKPSSESVYEDVGVLPLPTGIRTLTSFPDVLMIFELIFGCLVWTLISTADVADSALIQGWVMFVSTCCFITTFSLLILFCTGTHGGRASWTSVDAFYHCIAALFYLSASVLQAYATLFRWKTWKIYRTNCSAVVFAFITTLLYIIHAYFSLRRWKRSS
ncbi:myelin and lymphocyte protein-like [Discoglossus pictus]